MRFSVVIATYNRRDLLQRCLAAVTRLDYPDYEVVVADDGSTDGSVEAAQRVFPQVTYVPHPANTGEPAARNRGVRAARGAIIAFTDDDCVPPPDWLRRHARYYADPRVGAVGGPQICHAPNFYEYFDVVHCSPRFEVLQTIERIDAYEHLLTGNMSVRREVIERVGPFDEQFMTGCDSDFIRRVSRAGYLFVRDPELTVAHQKVHQFSSYVRMRFSRGCASVLTDVKEGTLRAQRFVPLLNVVRTWHNWRDFAARCGGGPGKFMGFWGLALLTRFVDVAGRAYYYWTAGRRYRMPEAGEVFRVSPAERK
jgi:GT2 family glycosyltransferase